MLAVIDRETDKIRLALYRRLYGTADVRAPRASVMAVRSVTRRIPNRRLLVISLALPLGMIGMIGHHLISGEAQAVHGIASQVFMRRGLSNIVRAAELEALLALQLTAMGVYAARVGQAWNLLRHRNFTTLHGWGRVLARTNFQAAVLLFAALIVTGLVVFGP